MQERLLNIMMASKTVIRDCTMKNGAIIAANPKHASYPKDAKNYGYVWVRDASFMLLAAQHLDLDIHQKFFDWCTKAEGWKKTGLFYKNYTINGKKYEKELQIDQSGMILYAIGEYSRDNSKRLAKNVTLVERTADAICRLWNEDHFEDVIQDLWEERFSFPDMRESFMYSVACCIRGLYSAFEMLEKREWILTAEQMEKVLLSKVIKHFYRSYGAIRDTRVDASLLGLVWPFGLVAADDRRARTTFDLIEKHLVKDQGVHRYEHDEYDGWMYKDLHRKKVEATGRCLTFGWPSICNVWENSNARTDTSRKSSMT